jgi:hypothetical protein
VFSPIFSPVGELPQPFDAYKRMVQGLPAANTLLAERASSWEVPNDLAVRLVELGD